MRLPHLTHPKYRADIDGLRAVAILSVLFFHAFPHLAPGGFVGVDIFFVISGFLISSILFSSLEKQRFSILEFYIRRIRRIFPALLVVLAATFAAGWYILYQNEFVQLSRHTIAGTIFIQNFILYSESGYFDADATLKPLLHLWSLAVEEQFYIFWPLLLALVWKRRWSFVYVSLIVGATSFAINIYQTSSDPTADFFLPFSRFWELMLGASLAYVTQHRLRRTNHLCSIASIVGTGLIIASIAVLDSQTRFPGWWALLPTLGTFLVIWAGPDSLINRRILSSRPMVWIGLISYPLYLWHWPLLSYLTTIGKGDSPGYMVLALALSFLLSWLTFRFIENRLRTGGDKLKVSAFLVGAMTIMFIIGILGWKHVIPARKDNDIVNSTIASENDWTFPKGLTQVENAPDGVWSITGKNGTTLFMGDSHAEQYAPRAISAVSSDPDAFNSVIFAAVGACPPIPGVFTGWDEVGGLPTWANSERCENIKKYAFDLIKDGEVDAVVISAIWNGYFLYDKMQSKQPANSNYYAIRDGKRYSMNEPSGIRAAMQNLNDFIAEISKSTRVLLVTDNPRRDEFAPRSIANILFENDYDACTYDGRVSIPEEQAWVREELKAMAIRNHVEYLDPSEWFCANGECRLLYNCRPIFKDSHHLTASFVKHKATDLDKLLMPDKK